MFPTFSPRVRQSLGIGLVALSLLAGLGLAGPAAADVQGEFQKGCEQGHGSYIENNDGSYQCNLASGGVIKCPDTTHQCSYTPRAVGGGVVLPLPFHLVLQGLPTGSFDLSSPPPPHHRHHRQRH